MIHQHYIALGNYSVSLFSVVTQRKGVHHYKLAQVPNEENFTAKILFK